MATDYRHIARQIDDLEFERAVGMVPQEFANIYPRLQKVMDEIAVLAPEFAMDCNAAKELGRVGYGSGGDNESDIAIARSRLKDLLAKLSKRAHKRAQRR